MIRLRAARIAVIFQPLHVEPGYRWPSDFSLVRRVIKKCAHVKLS